MSADTNPFPNDPDRHALWEMLVRRDIEAFLRADWTAVSDDFIATNFFGLGGAKSSNPDDWRMLFPRLEDYRDRWLSQARLSAETSYAEPRREALFRATRLEEIDISGNRALAHSHTRNSTDMSPVRTARPTLSTGRPSTVQPRGWRLENHGLPGISAEPDGI